MRPKNVVLVLLDSLNRHHLGAYGSTEFDTPTLDALSRRSVRFERHVTGSLPCMPARHDLLVGALDFLWRPWGSIELWEEPITALARRAGVTTMLVTDHPHLFETGGENYHCDFSAWDYLRGHEDDVWKTAPDPSAVGAAEHQWPDVAEGPFRHRYDVSRTWFREEADAPGPKTMAAAADWLERQAPQHDRFLLVVDEFDPHEPFDTPEPWASRYRHPDDVGRPIPIWPPYLPKATGRIAPEDLRSLRASYGAKLSMIDHHLGRVLDVLDRQGRLDHVGPDGQPVEGDTAVILCTDHGHYLGEHDAVGKPSVPLYAPMRRIPLLVLWPGAGARTSDALTTTVDLHATLVDLFDGTPAHRTHGASLVPVLEGAATSVRDWAVTGVWGREVHVTDGTQTYARAPVGDNAPLSMWSNRWSTMPIHAFPGITLPKPDDRAFLDRMPGSDVPVLRQPFAAGDPLPYWAGSRFSGHHLWHADDGDAEEHDRAGTPDEREAVDLLRAALDALEAPPDQLVRLGLA